MKTYKIIIGFSVLALILIIIQACSLEREAMVQNKQGVQLWGENCIRCHNIPAPTDFNDVDWSTLELHMKVRANLTEEESKKIFEFIKSVN